MIEEIQKTLVERYSGAENRSQHEIGGDFRGFRLGQRSMDQTLLIVQRPGDFVCHDFSDAFQVAAEAEHIPLDIHIAQFRHILAYERGSFCEIYNFHS